MSSPRPWVLASVRVWDGDSETLSSEPQHLRIDGGRIAAIGRDAALLEGAEVIALPPDAVALPGLIDAHVHMTLDPAVTSPDDQIARDDARITKDMEERALAMARAGITTARDLGAGRWLELALRDRIAAGELPGPRLICAGQPLTRPAGHCHFWGGAVDDGRSIEEVIERQVAHGVDCIKVMATGGNITPGSDPKQAQFSEEELVRVRERAALHDRLVAAHCHATAGIRNATAARLRTIEHCSFLGDKPTELDGEVCDAIGEQETWVSPTINAGWARFKRNKQDELSGFFRAKRAVFARLREGGAKLIASTDAGIPNVTHDRLARALAVFADYAELRPVEVLRSATSESARALAIDDETGRLRAGLAADVLVVRGDPLREIEALERPLEVFTRGRRVTGLPADARVATAGSGARSA